MAPMPPARRESGRLGGLARAEKTSPAELSEIGRLGGLARSAKYADQGPFTAAARQAASERFHREARERFPDASDQVITRVADALRRQHMTRLSRRRWRAQQTAEQAAAEAAAAEEEIAQLAAQGEG